MRRDLYKKEKYEREGDVGKVRKKYRYLDGKSEVRWSLAFSFIH